MKRLFSLASLSLAFAAGHVGAESLQIPVPANIEPVQSGLTRAEVIADYHMWRLAGLADLTRGDQSVDTNSYRYRKAYATYQHLRQSPQYAELVTQLRNAPNASVVAVPRATAPAQASN